MPKKFTGENKKAAAATIKKTVAMEQKLAKKLKEAEDAFWQEHDTQVLKKQEKKQKQEQKKQETQEKKTKNKALLDEESKPAKKTSKAKSPTKITRAQIDSKKTATQKKIGESKAAVKAEPLEPNMNRTLSETLEEARNVADAVALLDANNLRVDRNPEKRRKAAYTGYEERRLAELKAEDPTMRLSQMKQLIFKDWQNSPDNPLNAI